MFEVDEDWGDTDAPLMTTAGVNATKVDTAITVQMPARARATKSTTKDESTASTTATSASTRNAAAGSAVDTGANDVEEDDGSNPWLRASNNNVGLTPEIAMTGACGSKALFLAKGFHPDPTC